MDSSTGSYRALTTAEAAVASLQNAISVNTAATYASQTFSSNQVELKIETADYALDL